jgi:hypothetical protein
MSYVGGGSAHCIPIMLCRICEHSDAVRISGYLLSPTIVTYIPSSGACGSFKIRCSKLGISSVPPTQSKTTAYGA